jgi:hypothetical protein
MSVPIEIDISDAVAAAAAADNNSNNHTHAATEHWENKAKQWLATRQHDLWSKIKKGAELRDDAKDIDDDVSLEAPWTLGTLIALQVHIRRIFTQIRATKDVRVYAVREWLQRLRVKRLIDDIPRDLQQRFLLPPNDNYPNFVFTTDQLGSAAALCALPLERSKILQLDRTRFDPALCTFVTNDNMFLVPCASKSELLSWTALLPNGYPVTDRAELASLRYHHKDQPALEDFKVSATVAECVQTHPMAAADVMRIADALYTRPRLRCWAAQLHHRDPRLYRALRPLILRPDPAPETCVLVQALLLLQPMFPNAAETQRVLGLLEQHDATNFSKCVDGALPPLHIAAPTPLFTDEKGARHWINTEWVQNAQAVFNSKKPGWDANAVDTENNDWHFQCVFDFVLAAFHTYLCFTQANEYTAFPMVLIRSMQTGAAHPGVVAKITQGLMVYKNGKLALFNESRPWTNDTWFVLALLQPAAGAQRALQLEEHWTQPAPKDRTQLRVTHCSFFRRYVPDDGSQPLVPQGAAAPFTLLPMSGFR